MIGRLSGRVDFVGADHILLDVKGVGYIVYMSDRGLAAMPRVGEFTSVYTELLVREDLLQLFGFTTMIEKECHRLLVSVQGIGAKASMAILGTLGAEGVGRAIALGDWNAIKAAPGVGPKIAQRVTNELKDKAPAVMSMVAPIEGAPPSDAGEVIEAPVGPSNTVPPAPTVTNAQAEAMSALQNLGYAPAEAAAAVAEVLNEDEGADTAQLIRLALRKLAPKG